MPLDKLFCIINPNKSKRSPHQANKNNEPIKTNRIQGDNIDNRDAATMICKYVTTEFSAVVADEISVLPGDLVWCQYSNDNWTYVFCFRTNKAGFVPSDILSSKPQENPQMKKKLPRFLPAPTSYQNLDKAAPISSQSSSIAEHIIKSHHRHMRDHQPRVSIPHSLQSSSGGQTMPLFPESQNACAPNYFDMCSSDPPYPRYEIKSRQFVKENYGHFIVTHNFVAREENDLDVKMGDDVTVLNKEDFDWYWVRRSCDRAEGFVPSRFICHHERVKSILEKGNSIVTTNSSNIEDFHTYINHQKPEQLSLPIDQQIPSVPEFRTYDSQNDMP